MRKGKKYVLELSVLIMILLVILISGTVYEGLYPFGDKLWIRADSYTQYSIFYKYLREQLIHGGSFLYSFKLGLGGSFFTIMTYYLMSPLSFLVVFFKDSQIMLFMTVLIMIKIIFAGITFCLYLNQKLKLDYVYRLGLSIAYALMSFNLIYAFNIMWLDSIVLIPVALIGVDYLIREGKIGLLTVSVTLLFISNFYMAYMAGIGIFLYFVSQLIIDGLRDDVNWKRIVKFIGAVGISFGLAAWIILPINYALKMGPKVPLQISFLQRKQSIWVALSDLFGNNNHLFDGANLYCGILILITSIAFYFIPTFKVSTKLLVAALEAIFLLSYIYEYPYIIWHGFQQPTGFGFRFSFLISLLLLIITGFVIQSGLENLLKPMGYAILLTILLLLFLYKKQIIATKMLAMNVLMIMLLYVLLVIGHLVQKKQGFHLTKWLILGFIIIDSAQNMHFIIEQLNQLPGYVATEKDWRVNGNRQLEAALKYTKKDKTFYRTVVTPNYMLNQGMYNDYNGLSWFNTFGYQQLSTTLSRWGDSTTLGNKSLAYQQGNTIADSVLGLKYKVTTVSSSMTSVGYQQVYVSGNNTVYKNKNALPIAFLNDNLEVDRPFEVDTFQNQLLLFDEDKRNDIIQTVMNPNFTVHHVKISQKNNRIELIPSGKDAYIRYKIDIPANSELVTKIDVSDGEASYGKLDFEVNRVTRNGYPNFHNEGVLSLYRSKKNNENIIVNMKVKAPVNVAKQPNFTIIDGAALEKNVAALKKDAPKVLAYDDNQIEVQSNVKQARDVFFTIPYDKSWQATVDDNPMPLVNNHGFIQIPVKSGKSNIKLKYVPQGLKEGLMITWITLLIPVAVIIKRQFKNKQGIC